jgi:TadE-like protein
MTEVRVLRDQSQGKAGSRARRFLTKLARDSHGASAVEFAIVCPLLLAFVGGITEISLVFFAKAELTHYTREATRAVALGYMTPTEAQTYLTTTFESKFSFPITTSVVVSSPPNQIVTATATLDSTDIKTMTPFGVFAPTQVVEKVNMIVIKLK